MPMAMLRFSIGTARPTAPRITENEVPDKPIPISNPALNDRLRGESARPMQPRPMAYKMPPTITVRLAPKRSARAPVKGWVKPHIRFCKAMAKANTSRPQPNSALIGGRNKPNPCRIPSDSASTSDAPSINQPLVRHNEVIRCPMRGLARSR